MESNTGDTRPIKNPTAVETQITQTAYIAMVRVRDEGEPSISLPLAFTSIA